MMRQDMAHMYAAFWRETDVSCTGNIKAWHHAVICMSGKY